MFVKAEKGKGRKVIYHRNDGGKLVKTGGSPAWRNNNPKNIWSLGTFAKENGSIGAADGFAVFPGYETGRRALGRLLRTKKYWSSSIFDAVAAYAPVRDGNDVANYRKLLKRWTQLDLNRKLKSLIAKEFLRVVDAVERMESWNPGTEEIIEPDKISAVRRDRKGVIVADLLEERGWVSKAQLIAVIESEGGVDAVVVRPAGRQHLGYIETMSAEIKTLPGYQWIVRDADLLGGQPTVKGTRLSVSHILACLAEGMTGAEIAEDYPGFPPEALPDVLRFASKQVEKLGPGDAAA